MLFNQRSQSFRVDSPRMLEVADEVETYKFVIPVTTAVYLERQTAIPDQLGAMRDHLGDWGTMKLPEKEGNGR